jgi:hypothetical protein
MNRVQTKVMDIKPPKPWTRRMRTANDRRQINKFFRGLQRNGGIVGSKAVLFIHNEKAPELSYILTEEI